MLSLDVAVGAQVLKYVTYKVCMLDRNLTQPPLWLTF